MFERAGLSGSRPIVTVGKPLAEVLLVTKVRFGIFTESPHKSVCQIIEMGKKILEIVLSSNFRVQNIVCVHYIFLVVAPLSLFS